MTDLGIDSTPVAMANTMEAWCAIVGAISAELFSQFGPGFDEVAPRMFDRLIDGLTAKFV
ncbi:hypothetical protein [Devriesea agamarum]|uniref:hypothetical protein n=1 Tax=Devriesea agamarum TaxID=472569 RepID=UPI0012EE56D8|nr:hypothetical protein [Devriesea agamarum]